jgi:hypothetical protein
MIFLWSNMYEAAVIVQSVRAGRSVVLVRVAARFLETMAMNENLQYIAKKLQVTTWALSHCFKTSDNSSFVPLVKGISIR